MARRRVPVQAVRPKLFGAWEMNWLAFNTADDIALPDSTGDKITFFMYPQAETADAIRLKDGKVVDSAA